MGGPRTASTDAPSRRGRLAVRALQAGIAAVLLFGLASRNLAVVVNAILALGVTLLPGALARDRRVHLDPWPTLVVAIAVFLHAIGMVGLYDRVGWWDNLTHLLSGALVAAVGYATVRALDEHGDAVTLPAAFRFVFVLVFTLALAVLWEVLEFSAHALSVRYALGPVLFQYGLDDTMWDLVFGSLGALVVALFGARWLRGPVGTLATWLDRPP